ncbi:MAG TPA: TlpA disulfide reductase family protein [Gemmatimonadales bacterium]|nr:TlpA disulfide reductase family protein [Gemmatimonadales bacterium]
MNKQWGIVGTVVGLLVLGAFALVRFSPERTGVAVGEKAPDYRTVSLASGDTVSLRALAKGHVSIVNIWATWCGPCKEEMPAMQRTFAELGPQGFRILAVSIDEAGGEDVKRFADEMGITFDLLHDRSGRIQQLYQTTGVPESFLLDREGRIVKRVIGAHDWSSPANRRLIERYLGGAEAPAAAASAN